MLDKLLNLILRVVSRWHARLLAATKGGWGKGAGVVDMFLLITRGRNTGRELRTPLVYTTLDDAYIIAASYRGNPFHPAWYWNLVAQEEALVHVGGAERRVKVIELEGEERANAWAALVSTFSGFASYEHSTRRKIPVFKLLPMD